MLQKFKTIGVKLMKIASPDLTNYPLLECVAKLGNKTIISTGMGDETEIDEAVKIFKKHKHLLVYYIAFHVSNTKRKHQFTKDYKIGRKI